MKLIVEQNYFATDTRYRIQPIHDIGYNRYTISDTT